MMAENRQEEQQERARRRQRQRIILAAALALIVLCAIAGALFGLYQRSHQKNGSSSGGLSAPAAIARMARDARSFSAAQAAAISKTVKSAPQEAKHKTAKEAVTPKPAEEKSGTVPASSTALAGKVIVIDPGHQAHADTAPEPIGPGASETKPKVAGGTTGVVTHIPEGQTVLTIGLKLKAALEAQGATVVMTRTSQNVDVSNSQRAAIANNAHANLFLRLHCDGADSSSTHGISMLVPAQNQWTGPIVSSSRSAGETLQAAVIAATGAKNNGVVTRSDLSGFNYCQVPSVLIEMGFMTNPEEDRQLNDSTYQAKLVSGLVQGCLNWLK